MPSVSEQKIAQLCRALRSTGLTVGIEEELRLHTVLAGLDKFDQTQLTDAIAAIVLKSQRQRQDFERVITAWVSTHRRLPQPQPETTPDGPSQPARPKWRQALWGLVSVGALLGLLFLVYSPSQGTRGASDDMAMDAAPSSPSLDASTSPTDLQSPLVDAGVKPPPLPRLPPPPPPGVQVFVPHIAVSPVPIPNSLWAHLGLLLLAVGIGVVLQLVERKPLLPTPELLPTRPGPLRVLPASVPLARGTAAMLSRREEEIVVWGIGRFVSEEPSPRLDLRRTILATCDAAGQPVLSYLRMRHSREVWLWRDTSLGTYADGREAGVMQLAADLRAALGQAGLPLEEASYYGLPDRLLSQHGPFAPSEVDDRRDAAMVLLLTDGRLLALALASGQDRLPTLALLRQLSHWPRLAFVDCGQGVYRLRELLAPLGIAVLDPSEVPGFLGGTKAMRTQADSQSDLHVWIAGCALSPFPLDDQTALALRHKLRLSVSPWAIQSLRSVARSQGSRFVIPPDLRADKLRWLCAAEDLYRLGHVPKDSLLGQALDFYRNQLAQEDRHRRSRDALTPFVNTPAEQNLRVQAALLDLWDKPEQAARELFRRSKSNQARTIAEALRSLVSAEYLESTVQGRDRNRERAVTILPWRFDKLTPTARVQLQRLGFGQGVIGYKLRPVQLAPAARQNVAWAACAGLAVTGLVGTLSGLSTWLRPSGQPVVTDSHRPDGGTVTVDPVPQSSEYQLSAQYAFVKESQRVPAGAQVLVTWQEEQRDPPDGGSEEREDLGVDLATPPDLSAPEDLAQREDLRNPKERPDLAKPPWNPDMARGFRLPEVVSSTVPSTDTKPSGIELKDEWSCPNQEWTEPKSGVVFVKVCGRIFRMGSEPTDRETSDDETPSYPVNLSDYWIGKYEVSNEQYRKKKPGHKSTFDGDELPVQDVDWNEARAYCRSIGGDLPTEAEWEYAARGPEGRKYPWGNKPEPDNEHAVFQQGWDKGPEAITAKPKGRGPFGTLNQAGNVWEWVTDCYDGGAYEKRKAQSEKPDYTVPVSNPVDDRPGCDRRVLRGGSFAYGPRGLRSALRVWDGPSYRVRDRGFRCVRGSERQR